LVTGSVGALMAVSGDPRMLQPLPKHGSACLAALNVDNGGEMTAQGIGTILYEWSFDTHTMFSSGCSIKKEGGLAGRGG
jgi:hypothetical protein